MTVARSSIVPESGAGVFHCTSRCVRRSWLCGVDPYNGKDYSHRKQWVRDRLEELAGIYAIEVYAYAVMINHLHVVMRVDPGKVAELSDREVVLRWRRLFPAGRDAWGRALEPTPDQLATWLADKETLDLWRKRLGSLSWVMRSLNESLARRANKEDKCKGRFWEGRFKSQRLCDAGAVMACMAYVDLNPLRAGLAQTPESSEFTSVRERFEAECVARGETRKLESQQQGSQLKAQEKQKPQSAAWLTPVEDIVADEEFGRWGVSLAEYLELVDVTGRMLVEGKRGTIPIHLAPVLTRLELRAETWVRSVESYRTIFQRMAGSRERLVSLAKNAGQKWFCRGRGARGIYADDPTDRRVAEIDG